MLVVAEYEEGAIGTLTPFVGDTIATQGSPVLHIYGTRGSVSFESNGLFVLITGPKRRLLFPGIRDINGYQAMFRDFVAALQAGTEPVMSLARAQRDLELIEAAYKNVTAHPELEAVP